MKFSFEFSRSQAAKRPDTGAVIRSRTVQPEHARVLQDFTLLGRSLAARRPGRLGRSRMYDAAATDGLSADFPVSIQSANAEILVSAIPARSRARKLERDNPYAWNILNTFQNNVGGEDPFPLRMRVGQKTPEGEFIPERATNDLIAEWWEEAGLPENFTVRRDMSRMEAYLQAITALVRDGGILWRKHPEFPHNKFFYAVEPLEVDRLDHTYNRPATSSNNEIQFGIECDPWHAALAFWILTRHPGDVFAWSQSPRYRERVEASKVIALWDIRTRAGQYVGMPRFASVIKRLHREDQWDVAYVTAAIYAACNQIYLVRDLDANSEYKGDETSETGEEIDTVQPSVARILPMGYKPHQLNANFPTENSTGFKKDNLRAVGAGAGMAYHTLANDLEGVNFSSGRMGENAQRDEFKKLQQHVIINLVRPDFKARLRAAILSGQLPGLELSRLEEYVRGARFLGRRWPYVNPLQDVQADILRVQAGFDSRDRIVSESDRGGSFEDVCAEQAADHEAAEKHDLAFGSPATAPAEEPGEPGEGEDAKPPKKTGGKQTLKFLSGLLYHDFHRNGHAHR